MAYTMEEKNILRHIAIKSIECGLSQSSPPLIAINKYPDNLTQTKATFVTLKKFGQLRGCIGSLMPHRPLVIDVNNNAYRAAFEDPRFSPVTKEEVGFLEISISILTRPVPMIFTSEQDLIDQLVPFEDGLILEDMGQRGTFLPSVWSELNSKEVFLTHLKNKAGLSHDHWSNTIKVLRYKTETF